MTTPTRLGLLAVALPATLTLPTTALAQWSHQRLSEPRSGAAATSVGNLALFAGGFAFGNESSIVDIHDTATSSWRTARLSTARYAIGAASAGGRAYFGGGVGVSASSTLDVYDPATDTWTVLQLPTVRGATAAAAAETTVVFSDGRHADILDTSTMAWTSTTLSLPREGVCATAVQGFVLFAGSSSLTGQDHVDVYDDSIGAAYCVPATANSTGAPAELALLGFPGAASQGSVHALVTSLPPHALGLLLTSRTQGFTPNPAGSQGNLCLGGSIGRFVAPGQVLTSGLGGTCGATIDLTALPQPLGPAAVSAGETWNFQAWYRDAVPTPTSNFSSACSIQF